MSKQSLSNPFSQERKNEMTIPSTNQWNIPFGGGGWHFPGPSGFPNSANFTASTSSTQLTNSSSGQLLQTSASPQFSLPQTTPQATPPPNSNYPSPVILMSPTWHIPNQSPSNLHSYQLSFVNDADNLQVAIIDNSRGAITTHLVGKGTKFSFVASNDHDLTITVMAKKDESNIGIIAQVDNDPFNLCAKR
jgi:hypothetical protein